ncbi:constitutive coactivator of peroxisome proliferator-activated receptor gamma-like [Planococcus citri]|uniref:constitutive coactivator of peroxisome proliferator-activated receptor gamma-like n=1 Tax=Planococcus citri TaxID=170843 RepID=UPI0031F8A7EC
MGVRGLQTFLEQYCPSACYWVKIAELAAKYKEETGKEPVIAVDAQSCYGLWCKGLDWVIGFEIQEFLHRLRMFVESFTKVGVKIVFFFGGLTVEKKRASWIGRRRRNLRDIYDVVGILEKGTLTKDLPERYASLPPTMGIFTSMFLKYILGCEVYMTIEECDEEIIEYVHKNDCFAIFAQDSDFLASDIKCAVLSSKNFNMGTMTTLLYEREVLAKILRIRTDQLPLLAVLAGNDLIDFEILKGFHCSICGIKFENNVKFDMLMPAIGRYINKLPDQPIDELLKTISIDVFGDESALGLIKACYNSYLVQETPKITNPATKWSRVLQIARFRHRNVLTPAAIWGVLSNQVFELAVTFEDLRRANNNRVRANSFIPSATVTRLLRQKMYGILLYEYEHLADVEIKEWCGENEDSYLQPVIVKPVEPTVHHPGLLQLWSDNNSDRHIQMKWKLFLSSISPNITSVNEWTALTEDLVAISAALFYLFEQEFFSGFEMNAAMATVATFSLYSRERLETLYYGPHNSRATHISVAVIRTFSMVIMLMAACGYPVPLSGDLVFIKFEAKLFQIKYKDMKQRKTVEEMCENDERCIAVFNQMRKALSRATRKSKRNTNRKPQPSENDQKQTEDQAQTAESKEA